MLGHLTNLVSYPQVLEMKGLISKEKSSRRKPKVVNCYVPLLLSWWNTFIYGLMRFVYNIILSCGCIFRPLNKYRSDYKVIDNSMQVAQTLVPLINFDLHEEVRKVSVMGMLLLSSLLSFSYIANPSIPQPSQM